FAVQSYKPAFFYILDEVDAALDSENAERIARMIKKFSLQTQFIIITHNQITSKYSDHIIGVYMGKDGSSSIQLNLKEYRPEES
ncbi:MAG: hypothetical protein QW097_00295, partial [archaeon]